MVYFEKHWESRDQTKCQMIRQINPRLDKKKPLISVFYFSKPFLNQFRWKLDH